MSEANPTPNLALDWDLADRLRKSLRVADISVQEMADTLEVSRNTVGNWMSGRRNPSGPYLRVWALRTGVPFRWLRDGEAVGPDTDPTLGTRSFAWVSVIPGQGSGEDDGALDGTVVPLFPSYHSDEVEAA